MKTLMTTALTVLLIIGALAGGFHPAAAESPDEVYSFAEHLKKDGMFEAAAQQFLKFSRENPVDRRSPTALEAAAECLVELGNIENAVTVLETLVGTYPQDSDLCKIKLQLGRLYYKLERFEAAEREFTDVVVTMPDCAKVPDALLGKAEALIAMKKFEAARDVLSSLLAHFLESPAAPRASYNLAFCLRQLGREAEALNGYQRICTQFPRDPLAGFASLEAARMFTAREDTAAAVRFYDNARRFDAKVFFLPASEEGAALLDASGQHQRAQQWYEEMLARPDLENPRVIHIKSIGAAYRAGDYSGVRRIADDYNRRFPKTFSPQITYATALVKMKTGEYEGVLSDVDALEAFAPGTEWARKAPRVRGDALLATGRPLEAIGELRRFVSLSADSSARVEALEKMADIQFSVTGDTTGALNTLGEILEVEKRALPLETLRIGLFFERSGRFKQAKTLYEDLVGRFPLSDEAETAQARVEFLDGFTQTDYQAAAAAMDRAAYQIATMNDWEALIFLIQARMDVLKDFYSALGLCKQIKKSSEKTAHYPQLLYLEGLSHARLARMAFFAERSRQAQDEVKEALKPWKELEEKHGGTPWAASAAFQQLLLRSEVEGRVDTVAVQRVLARYPDHEDTVLLLELLGDYYAGPGGAIKQAQEYYARALARTSGEGTAGLRFKAAKSLADGGRYQEAYESFKRISDSQDRRLGLKSAYEAGSALRALKRFGEAIPFFDRVSDNDPHGALGANAMLQSADCKFMQRDYKGALAQYERAESKSYGGTRGAEISYRVALCLKQLGRNQEALTRMEQCLNGPLPAHLRPRAYRQAADIARELGLSSRERDILEAYVEKIEQGDDVAAAARDLVRLYLRLDDTGRALAAAERISRSAPENDCEAAALLAMAYYRQGRRDRASKLAEKVTKNAGENGRALTREIAVEAAKYHYGQKSYSSVVAELSSFVEGCNEPGVCEELRYFYILGLFGDNQLERGSEASQKYFRDFPLSAYGPALHLRMGNVLTRENRTSESLLHYEEAATTAADSATAFQALNNLGISYQNLKRWREAERVWVRVLNRFPSSDFAPNAALNIARCKMESGDYSGAIAAYQESLPLLDSEAKARAFYWMGTSYEQLGDFQSAVVEYLKVPFLHPGEGLWVVTAQLKAAECYTRIDRKQAARDIYNRVIQRYGADSNWGKLAQKGIDSIDAGSGKPNNDGTEQ